MTGSGHIRKRGTNSWSLKWDIPPSPDTGERITKYRTVRGTKKDAQRELRQILIELDGGLSVDSQKMTVAQFLRRWLLDYARQSVSAKTLERYEDIIRNHLIPVFGSSQLKDLHPLHIQAAYTKWLASGRKDGKGGLSPQTVKHHHRLLFQVMKKAVQWRLLARNPVEDVDPPKVQRTEILTLDRDELNRLIQKAFHTPLYMPVLIAAGTGMRRGEILGLKWSDIDIPRRTLTVERSLQETKDGLALKPPKTKLSRRSITLPKFLIAGLEVHWLAQRKEQLALAAIYKNDGLVCAKKDGAFISPEWLSRRFGEFMSKQDMTQITFHGLRHTHFTHLLERGVHPKVASERAGHSSVAVTLDIYSHVSNNLQQEAATFIDEIVSITPQK